eukprot:7691345-Pyramimonas_sp.AAC.1
MVKRLEFSVDPQALIRPGSHGPRHEFQGLAIFTVAAEMPRRPPMVLAASAPVLHVEAAPSYMLDFPADALPEVLRLLGAPALQH